MAAARPFGPEPITTASGIRRLLLTTARSTPSLSLPTRGREPADRGPTRGREEQRLLVLAAVAAGDLGEGLGRHLVRLGNGDAHRCQRPQRRSTRTTLEQCPLTKNRARSDLRNRFAIDLDREHAIEQEKQLMTAFTLLDERLVLAELAKFRLLPAAHDLLRQLSLEFGLDLGDERRRVFHAPGRFGAEDVARPAGEVGE